MSNKKDRFIIFNENVRSGTVKDAIQKIYEINSHDDEKESREVGYIREPIQLVINSYGGSVYDGFALMAVMEISKTPIHTYCHGYAMSMGFSIFLAGHKRFAHSLATFMYHQISDFTWGKLEEIKSSLQEGQRLEEIYDSYVLKKTNILKEKLDDVKSKKQDWFMSTEEAKKYGVVEIIL